MPEPTKENVPGFLQETEALLNTEPVEEPEEKEETPDEPEEAPEEKEEEEPTPDNEEGEESDEEEPKDGDDEEESEEDKPEEEVEDEPDKEEPEAKDTDKKETTSESDDRIAELEKQLKETSDALSKLTKNTNEEPPVKDEKQEKKEEDQLLKQVEQLKQIPLISPELPDASNYRNDDGTFDINSYMGETVKRISLSVQQSLLGGPLAATQFAIMQRALQETQTANLNSAKEAKKAEAIWNNVQEKFPVLSKDERLQSIYERAIHGEKAMRKAKAGDGEPEPMTEEDYINLAQEIVGENVKKTKPVQKEDPAETPKGGPTIDGGERKPKSEIDQVIEGMMGAKQSNIFEDELKPMSF